MRPSLERVADLRQPAAVVLGLGQNGLATVRALARRSVPVIGVDASLSRPTAHTRYCLRLSRPEVRTEDGLIALLLEIGRRLRDKGVLFPSGDLNLLAVSERREELAPYFQVELPAKEAVRLILDKQAFYAWAVQEGFAIPRTQVLRPGDDAETVARALGYPVILKPYLRDAEWRRRHEAKLYEVRSPEELRRAHARLAEGSTRILLQESIPGPDSLLVFSLTYLDEALEPLAIFTGRKLRQYPPRFGTSSLAESRWDPEVAAVSLRMLGALRYRGYGSVEFKRDPRDGQLRVIEVTGRTWYPHGLATACGVNLPYLAYARLIGRPVTPPRGFVSGRKWVDEDRDLRSALQEHRAGRLTLAAWAASYRGRLTLAIAAVDDPGPILALGRRWLRAAGRALARRGRRTLPTVRGMEDTTRTALRGLFHVARRAGMPGTDFARHRHVAILRYHSVSGPADDSHLYVGRTITHAPEQFDRHVAVLSQRYRCVSMDDVAEALAGGRALPPNAVVITFDDGYRDNYEQAYPILRRHGVPATVYVTTGCLDGRPLWTSELRYLVHATDRPALHHPLTGEALDLATPGAKQRALRRLRDGLIALRAAQREDALAALRREAAVALAPLREKFLTWEQVREMARGGITFGAHTVSHPLLPRMPLDEADREIAESKATLEAELGVPVRHFAYPNPSDGHHCSAAVKLAVRNRGFVTAVSSQQGYVRDGADPLELDRLSVGRGAYAVPWDLEREALREALSVGRWAGRGEPVVPPTTPGDPGENLAAMVARLTEYRERGLERALRRDVAALEKMRRTLTSALGVEESR